MNPVERARQAVLDRFRWDGGHADVWRVFADGAAFAAVVDGMAHPWRAEGITAVVGIESRGFLLGGAVAAALGTGFHAIRKPGGMLPGPKLTATTAPDYRGLTHELRMKADLGPSDVVVLVDDWAERGSQALAVQELVAQAGARLAGLSLMVDQLDDDTRRRLPLVHALVRFDELGDPEAPGQD